MAKLHFSDARGLREKFGITGADALPATTEREYDRMLQFTKAPLSQDLLVVLALRIADTGSKPVLFERPDVATERNAEAKK